MRKIILLSIAVLFTFTAFSQDQSNKGRDFWFAYPAHNAGTTSRLAIYLTSDVNSSGTVTFNGNTINFNVIANQTTILRIGNATTPSNASCYIGSNNTIEINRGIRIQATSPVAAYAHILNAAVSGSTLLLPVNVLGKDYVVASHVPQGGTAGVERCQFVVVGVENNTTVEITPTSTDVSGTRVANVPFQINLNAGDVYQFQSNEELSGSTVKSIANGGNACQKIVVIGSTTRSAIGCPISGPNGGANPTSGDNIFQQLPPKSAWGKRYLTAPFIQKFQDKIRVFVTNPLTPVIVNGTNLPLGTLINNSYYEFNANTAQEIVSVDPIAVYQYIYTQNCDAVQSDPEMIYISPIEQTIKDIAFVSAERSLTPPNTNITSHFLNLILKNTGTSISSLTVDGAAPAATYTPIGATGYSYTTINLSSTTTAASPGHRVINDSGFIAIAYGYGNVESYGYNAGTNVRDLNQQLEVNNPNADPSETSSACTNSPFKFKVYFPSQDNQSPPVPILYDSMKWEVLPTSTGFTPNNFPVMVYGTVGAPPKVAIDSINIRNGKQVAWYSLPTTYSVNTPGAYTIRITVYRTSTEGCGNELEYEFPLNVSDPPTASFTAPAPGCYLEPLVLTETTPQIPKATYRWWWEVTELAPGPIITTTYTSRNPIHPAFTRPGLKRIRHASITTPGCLSDTIVQTITVPDLPTATLTGNTTVCINAAPPPLSVTFSDGRAPWQFIYSINGVNQPPITTSSNPYIINAATGVANTFTYRLVEVRNSGSTLCVTSPVNQEATVVVQPDHDIAAGSGNSSPTTCVNVNIAPFTLTLAGGATNIQAPINLPPGVTATVVGNIVTIAGAPTTAVGSPFNYTIRTTGNSCLVDEFNGTITVNDDSEIQLTSGTGTNNQTKCVNTPIDNIEYTISRGATNATLVWLAPGPPPGTIALTQLSANLFRISGSATVANTYNYRIETTGPCVQDFELGTLVIQPDATVTLRAGDNANQTRCINTAISDIRHDLNGTYTTANIVWSPSVPTGLNFSVAGSVTTITGTPTSVGTFTYQIVPVSVCAVPIPPVGGTITITGDATIQLTTAIGTDNQTVCRNTPIADIEYQVGGTGTSATITWSPSAPTGINFTPFGTLQWRISGTPTVVGTQTYTYTISTVGPCFVPNVTGTITVNALPIASFTPPAIRCANSVLTFTNTSTANAGGNTDYTWDFGDPNANAGNPNNVTTNTASPNATHYYIVPNTTPGYTVTLTATNSNGCISNPIASVIVPVNDTPRAGFIVPEVCINDVATVFTDTSRINAGNTITGWDWNFGDPPGGPYTQTSQNGTHLYPSPNIYNVSHVAISNFGCRDTITQPITINSADPNAAFNILNRNILCSSDSVDLQNISTVGFGNVTKLDIYWDNLGAPGTFETINDPVFNGITRHKYPTLQTNRNYQIRVVAYSGNVCFTSRIDNITVYANPLVQFNNIPPTCLLVAPFQITQGSEIGGVPGTGTYSGVGITNPTGTFNPQVAGVGTHAIKYTFTASNPGACIDTLTRFITVIDTAQSLFTVSSPTCDGQTVTFTDNSDPRGNTLQTITWDFGHAPPNNTATSLPGQAITHIFPTYGFYDVRMFTTSSVGCLSTPRTIRIYVSPIPNPQFIPEKTSYCLPSESNVRFINNSTIVDGTALTYSWNFDDPNATPSNPNTSTAISPSHNYTSTGPFVVKLTATSIVGCAKDFTYNLTTVHPQPKAAFSTDKPAICIADDVVFRDESDPKDGTTVTRYWDFTGSGTFTSTTTPTITHTYSTVNTYAPTLYVVNSFGCHSDTLSQPFVVHPYPVVNAGKDRTILEFGSVKLDPTVTGEDLSYLWTPNIYFGNNNKIKQPTASLVKDDITYRLTVTSRGGCTATDDVFVKVLKFPQIPNTFTPNNDGINDFWRIEYLDSYPNCKVQVFNRTGQTVFESKGVYKSWDGTMKGKPLPFDTYYYVIEPGNGRDPVTGYVTIVK